ncbi:MAG TPA: hypothetical protein DEB39_16775, partial [Planctomycetaceae bacterium]|nr:hypothetical protein [Planctomycetaceae bacterium]
ESVIILKDTENGFEWCHPEESYGQTLDALIEDVFEENRHPYEVAKKFRLLFNAIENNQLDEAKQRYKALKSEICSDVDLISADIMISKKEFLEGRK